MDGGTDPFENGRKPFEHIGLGYPYERQIFGFEFCLPEPVPHSLFRVQMDAPVDFDHEPGIVAVEIDDEAPNCVLATELVAIKPTVSQGVP